MKKKTIAIVAAIFVLVAIAALAIFAFFEDPAEDLQTVDLTGTWKVAAYFSNGTPTLPENDFMVFAEDTASAYRDGAMIATSQFSLSGGASLTLPEISRSYTVERCTDNYIRLYENANVYTELIRYPNEDMSKFAVDASKLYDKWNVAYRNTDTPVADEVLVFTETTIEDYRNGAAEPAAVSEYVWSSETCLLADKWGIGFELVQLSDETIFFIESESGLIWELHRAL